MYSFSVQVKGDMESVEEKVTDALKTEGFGVLTEIDVQATMKKKLDIEQEPYKILGACNPKLAHKAIETEADIGLLLPCNVVIRAESEGVMTVAFMDPSAVLTLVDKEGISTLASEVRERLVRVSQALAT